MASLFIAELDNPALHLSGIQVVRLPPLRIQEIEISDSPKRADDFHPKATIIRLFAETSCTVLLEPDMKIPISAELPEYFGVSRGLTLTVIAR